MALTSSHTLHQFHKHCSGPYTPRTSMKGSFCCTPYIHTYSQISLELHIRVSSLELHLRVSSLELHLRVSSLELHIRVSSLELHLRVYSLELHLRVSSLELHLRVSLLHQSSATKCRHAACLTHDERSIPATSHRACH